MLPSHDRVLIKNSNKGGSAAQSGWHHTARGTARPERPHVPFYHGKGVHERPTEVSQPAGLPILTLPKTFHTSCNSPL